jgi:hypothetical protein
MKAIVTMVMLALTANTVFGSEQVAVPEPPHPQADVSGLTLEGEIDGENIVFTLRLNVASKEKAVELPLVIGDVAYLDGSFPSKSKLIRRGDTYLLRLPRMRRSGSVSLTFASRPVEAGDWRRTMFKIPTSSTRKLSIICDRDDLEVVFPGALEVNREKTDDERTRVSAFLGISEYFEVAWKPEVRRLDSELVAACDANTIATANVGAMRLDSVLSYRIIQGRMSQLVLGLPDVNVTSVQGEDIQEWSIDTQEDGSSRLVVVLGRPKTDFYHLRVESEIALPEFPSQFNLPVVKPLDVIRHNGFILVGTDNAIKLQVIRAAGLTQVDQASFPAISLEGVARGVRVKPTRSAYAFQYASTPQALELSADDIVTSFTADERIVVSLTENELAFDTTIELDISEAPLREVTLEIDPDPAWTVTSVSGQNVAEADVDVRFEDEGRILYVPLKEAASGTVLFHVRMERTLENEAESFIVPRLHVRDAKSERGYIVVAADRGVRLKTTSMTGLRDVFTGSAPMRVKGAQQAFRFKSSAWNVELAMERTLPAIHSEVFHLVSLGEGVMYYSAAITYHVGSAPVQAFKIRVPEEVESVEFTGINIESWTRADDIYTVRLQSRTMDDYTLLVSYDQQFPYKSALLNIGGTETLGTESEVGYIAVASSISLKLTEAKSLPETMFRIDRDEIPVAYSAAVSDPIIASYKYVRSPHVADIRVEAYESEQLLGQVSDFTQLSTTMSRDGESVTTALVYIKNTTRQFLVLRLPEGADLWSIRSVESDGTRTDLLSQESQEGILIPVRRPRDPNTPMQLEITYAESHGNLGFWSSGLLGMKLQAPSLPETHGTFAKWNVKVPDGFTIARSGGNMTTENPVQTDAVKRVSRTTRRVFRAMLDGWGRYTIGHALVSEWEGRTEHGFTRAINLSEEKPPTLSLRVVPIWMGGAGSTRLMTAALAGGFVLMIPVVRRRSKLNLLALGLTFVIVGLAQASMTRSAMALFLAGLIMIAIIVFLSKGGLKLLWRGLGTIVRGVTWPIRTLRRSTVRKPGHRQPHEVETAAYDTTEDGPSPFESDNDGTTTQSGRDGFTSTLVLVVLTLILGLTSLSWARSIAMPPAPVVDVVDATIEGPSLDPDQEQSASIALTLRFSVPGPAMLPVIPPGGVLISSQLDSSHLDLVATSNGYILQINRKGTYAPKLRFRVPVVERDGQWAAGIRLPPNMKNRILLQLPEVDLDVTSPSAVVFRTAETNGMTQAEAVFGPVSDATFLWKPRARSAELEDAVFFSEVNTLVTLRSGVVDLNHRVRYQIAQGEIKDLQLMIPEGMTVTAVQAKIWPRGGSILISACWR